MRLFSGISDSLATSRTLQRPRDYRRIHELAILESRFKFCEIEEKKQEQENPSKLPSPFNCSAERQGQLNSSPRTGMTDQREKRHTAVLASRDPQPAWLGAITIPLSGAQSQLLTSADPTQLSAISKLVAEPCPRVSQLASLELELSCSRPSLEHPTWPKTTQPFERTSYSKQAKKTFLLFSLESRKFWTLDRLVSLNPPSLTDRTFRTRAKPTLTAPSGLQQGPAPRSLCRLSPHPAHSLYLLCFVSLCMCIGA